MGIFGRSKADQDLIEAMQDSIDKREGMLTTLRRQNDKLEDNLNLLLTVGHFRDDKGRLGKQGVIPDDLKAQLNA